MNSIPQKPSVDNLIVTLLRQVDDAEEQKQATNYIDLRLTIRKLATIIQETHHAHNDPVHS